MASRTDLGPDMETPLGATVEETDAKAQVFTFGEGGVPWYLLLVYLGFLIFFTWYTLEYQLPDFVHQGPVPLEGVEPK